MKSINIDSMLNQASVSKKFIDGLGDSIIMSVLRFALPTVFAAILIAPLSAQAGQYYPHTINQRQVNQQRRIYDGVKNDQISRQEYRNLQRRSLSIQRQERRDRLDGNGFTARERYHINQRLNNVSRSIYGDRHH